MDDLGVLKFRRTISEGKRQEIIEYLLRTRWDRDDALPAAVVDAPFDIPRIDPVTAMVEEVRLDPPARKRRAPAAPARQKVVSVPVSPLMLAPAAGDEMMPPQPLAPKPIAAGPVAPALIPSGPAAEPALDGEAATSLLVPIPEPASRFEALAASAREAAAELGQLDAEDAAESE
jgi:hypothetical protein